MRRRTALVALAVTAGLLPAAHAPAGAAAPDAAPALAAVTQPAPHRAVFIGGGFDACETASTATMRAWLGSPYRAVNIYFAGSQRACSTQLELTPQWVSTVTADGWSLIPTYVGLQAPCYGGSKTSFTRTNARTKGAEAADDAATALSDLGIPGGNPAYLDLEPFDVTNDRCSNAVVDYVEAWTLEMHARGYKAGVYAHLTMGLPVIRDRANPRPDDIWWARYDGNASTSEPTLDGRWVGHRIHQYRGPHNETYNGRTIEIDNDQVHADTVGKVTPATPSGPPYVYAASSQGNALKERAAPHTGATLNPTTYAYGDPVPIECQAVGDTVYGSYVWDRIADVANDDRYVADVFTTTTGGTSFTAGIPRCDRVRPVATLAGVPLVTRHSQRTFTWSATDDASGIASYDVRYRRAAWNGGFGRWSHVDDTTGRKLSVPMAAGYDYCLQVRATDRSFNTSRWTAPACTARPLDDRALTVATSGWTRGSNRGYYFRTFTAAGSRGRVLTRSGAELDRVGVVATRCPSCGKVDVYVGKRFLGTVSLHAGSLQRSKVVMLPPFSLRSRQVRLVTHGRSLVRIDGLVISRT